MNKDYLDSLSKDQLETRIYDLKNELRQEWYQEKIMKFKTARKLEGEVAYCKTLLENFKPVERVIMKTYTITKTITNYIEAKDDKELNELYSEGVIDEVLSNINPIERYVITDEKGNIIRKEEA